MKQFGIAKFAPKPKTEKDWTRVYARHRYEVPNVKKISLTLSSKGAGQTGARHFKAYAIPPIKYWNPNVEVAVQLDAEKAVEPVLTVEFKSGETQTINLKGVHVDKIKADLFTLEPSKQGTSRPAAPSL